MAMTVDEATKHLDSLLDDFDKVDASTRLRREELAKKPNQDRLDWDEVSELDRNSARLEHTRQNILKNNSRWYVPRAEREKPPAPAADEGPGMLSRILGTAKQTVTEAVKHPGMALHEAGRGVEDLVSLPLRLLEQGAAHVVERATRPRKTLSDVVSGHEPKGYEMPRPLESGTKSREAEFEQASKESGYKPTGVTRAVGGALVPFGPAMKAGQILKNAAKSGAFTGGLYAGEQLADDKPVDDGGLVTSTAVGGGLGALAGILTKGKVKVGDPTMDPTKTASGRPLQLGHDPAIQAGEGADWATGVKPKLLEQRPAAMPMGDSPAYTAPPTKPGPVLPRLLEHHEPGYQGAPAPRGLIEQKAPPIEGQAPPKELPAPQPAQPSYFRTMMDRIQHKNPKDFTPEEQGFVRAAAAQKTPSPPPNAAGTKDYIDAEWRAVHPDDLKPTPKAPTEEQLAAEELRQAVHGTKPVEEVVAKPPPKTAPVPAPTEPTGTGAVHAPKASPHDDLALKDEFAHTMGMSPEEVHAIPEEHWTPMRDSYLRTKAQRPTDEALTTQPRSDLPHRENTDLYLRAEKAKADLGSQAPGKKGGKVFDDGGQFEGSYQSDNAEWYKEATSGPQKLSRQRVERAVDKIIEDDGRDVGKDVSRVKELLLRDREFMRSPFAPKNEAEWADHINHVLTEQKAKKKGGGVTLGSGLGGMQDLLGKHLNDLDMKAKMATAKEMGKDIPSTVKGVWQQLTRPAKTSRWIAQEHPIMGEAVDLMKRQTDAVGTFVRNLLYRGPDGEKVPTNYHKYLTLPDEARDKVNRFMVYENLKGTDHNTPEGLKRLEKVFTPDQIAAYQGARSALKEIHGRARAVGMPMGEIKGYLPRTWGGKYEVMIDGKKHLRDEAGHVLKVSSYDTRGEALQDVYKLKQANPNAKIEVKHWADPDFLHTGPMEEGILLNRLKKNLATMKEIQGREGIDPKLIDEAWQYGQSQRGFAKHLEQRKGAEGYATKNVHDIIQGYVQSYARKIEMHKMKTAVSNLLESDVTRNNLRPDQINWLKSAVERTAGKPAWDEIAIKRFIADGPLGKWIDPNSGMRALHGARTITTHLSLGVLNGAYASVNSLVLGQHVWPALQREISDLGPVASEKYLTKAVAEFFTDKKTRDMLAHEGVIDLQFMLEPGHAGPTVAGGGMKLTDPHTWSAAKISMVMGSATETFTRGVAALARYKSALAQGMTKDQAIEASRRFVSDTIGDYSRAGRPEIFTGAIGATAGMFKTFTSVIMQNMVQNLGHPLKNPGAALRYAIGTIGAGGLMGLPFAKDIDQLYTAATGTSPQKFLEDHLPKATVYGIGSIAGDLVGNPDLNVDMSSRVGAPDIIPNDFKSALGPVFGRPYQAAKDIGQGHYKDAAWDMFGPNSLRSVHKATSNDLNYRDRPTVNYTPTEKAIRAAGFQPQREADQTRTVQRRETINKYRSERLKVVVDDILDGDRSAYAEFRKLGGTQDMIRQAMENRRLTMIERQQKRLPKAVRGQ